MKVIPGTRRVH